MPSSSLHQSCDSAAHRVSFTLCCSSHKVLSAVFFGLSSRFFCLHMTCHTLNSILASLESQGHTLSTSKSAPTNTTVSTSSSFLSPASVSISAEAHSQGDFLSISAVAPAHEMLAAFRENEEANSSSSASSSRNSRAASSAVGVPLTYKLTLIAPLSSSYAGRVTVPSFISTHPTTGNMWSLMLPSYLFRLCRHNPCLILHLLPLTSTPILVPSVGKVFVVGPN